MYAGLVGLPLLQHAFEEVFGADAINAQLRDPSGFTDVALNSLMEQLHGELLHRKASLLKCEFGANNTGSTARLTWAGVASTQSSGKAAAAFPRSSRPTYV
jgi:hypothetical protein